MDHKFASKAEERRYTLQMEEKRRKLRLEMRPNCPRILPRIQGHALTCNIPMDHIPGTPEWRCPLCEHILHDEALFNSIKEESCRS